MNADLALVMTDAPSAHQNLFVACAGIGVVVFATAMFVAFLIALHRDYCDQAPAPAEPAADYPQPVGVS